MDDAPQTAEPRPPDIGYGALFLKFLGFGLLAFGGPWRSEVLAF